MRGLPVQCDRAHDCETSADNMQPALDRRRHLHFASRNKSSMDKSNA